eukprot:Em0011g42a
METKPAIQFHDITAAAYRIKKGVKETPLEKSLKLSAMLGMEIYFKKDLLLPTGSFKERGVRNALELLPPEQKKKGVIAASAGNHALALAYHGQLMGIPVEVVTPETAPLMKVSQCRNCGAVVTKHGSNLEEAKQFATIRANEQQLQYINGYDYPPILAGQGTAALEIIEQLERLGKTADAVVIPVGGGGLLAGMAVAFKHLQPQVEVIAAESEECPGFSESLKVGRPSYVSPKPSLADGLAVPLVGTNSFATAKDKVDKCLAISESDIAIAILRLVEMEKIVVEGAGATGLAACLSGQLDHLKGKTVVVMLSGGNIDTTVLGRCLERGLAADGRLVKFGVLISDRPGGIAGLTQLLYEQHVSVKDIVHERTWLKTSIFFVEVDCVVETTDEEHALRLKNALITRYGAASVHWGGWSYTGDWGGVLSTHHDHLN